MNLVGLTPFDRYHEKSQPYRFRRLMLEHGVMTLCSLIPGYMSHVFAGDQFMCT